MLEGKYERIKKIAEGAYGIVYKTIDHSQMPKNKETSSINILTKALAETSITNTENISPNAQLEEYKIESSKLPLVAIKKLRVQEGGDEIYTKEINFLKQFNHPNIIKLLDVFKRKTNTYLVLEYFETDLEKIINDSKVTISKEQVRNYMRQILECAKYLHDNKVMHRDFKPSNVFVSSNGALKCGDFGIARAFPKPGETLTKTVCTR